MSITISALALTPYHEELAKKLAAHYPRVALENAANGHLHIILLDRTTWGQEDYFFFEDLHDNQELIGTWYVDLSAPERST